VDIFDFHDNKHNNSRYENGHFDTFANLDDNEILFSNEFMRKTRDFGISLDNKVSIQFQDEKIKDSKVL